MSYKNYYMANTKNQVEDVTEEIEQEIEAVNDSEVVEVVEVAEIVEEPAETETAVGVVTGCAKLNVRRRPSLTADVVCVVDENSPLVIDVDDPSSEWYKIFTESGFNGYCMKKYVSVNQ